MTQMNTDKEQEKLISVNLNQISHFLFYLRLSASSAVKTDSILKPSHEGLEF